MAAPHRNLVVLIALCAGLALSGCANGQLELDPAYWFPDGKKKLPGERREVFPEGVPGVTQGIPAEMVRGSPAQQAASEQALAPVQETKPQAEEKPKPRPKKVARPRPAPAPEAEPQPRTQAQPAPRPAPPSGAWPAPAPQQPQAQQQSAPPASAWPSPPNSGTFTR